MRCCRNVSLHSHNGSETFNQLFVFWNEWGKSKIWMEILFYLYFKDNEITPLAGLNAVTLSISTDGAPPFRLQCHWSNGVTFFLGYKSFKLSVSLLFSEKKSVNIIIIKFSPVLVRALFKNNPSPSLTGRQLKRASGSTIPYIIMKNRNDCFYITNTTYK